MNCRNNLTVAFIVSIALHGIVVLGVAGLVATGSFGTMPVFRNGISSVLVVTMDAPASDSESAAMPDVKAYSGMNAAVVPVPLPEMKGDVLRLKAASITRDEELSVLLRDEVVPPIIEDEPGMPGSLAAGSEEPHVAVSPRQCDPVPDSLLEQMSDIAMPGKVIELLTDGNAVEAKDGNCLTKGAPEYTADSFIDVRRHYPAGSIRRGEEGVVVVKVTVSSSGRVDKVDVMKSSGYSSLDESAIHAMKKARLIAKAGSAVRAGEYILPYRFKLVN